MANRYWVGGTGTWDASSTTHWSTVSGGSAGATAPTSTDAVIFDGNSGTGTVTTSGALSCASLNCGSYSGTLTLGAGLTVNGNITLAFGMTFTPAGFTVTVSPAAANSTVNGAGKYFAGLTIAAGSYTVSTGGSGVTCTGTLTLTSGGLSGSFTAANFSSNNSNTRTLALGGNIVLTGTGTVWDLATTTGLTFTKGSANILLSDTSATARTFAGGGLTYNKLTIGGTTGSSNTTITGSNTFSELASMKTVAHTITFTSGTTTTIGAWTIAGTAGNLVTLAASTTSAANLVYNGSGRVSSDYLSISYSTVTPASTWYAGTHSTNGGNNSGWNFTAPPNSNGLLFGSIF